MKHLGLLLFCAWAWSGTEVERVEKGNLVIEGIPEIPEELQKRMAMYQNTRSAFLADWHPSGEGILISTRFGETNQIHWVKHPGGARHQLTFASEPIRGGEVSPDPKRNGFLYTKDVGGTENYQVFFFELATGKSTMLSDGTSRNGGGSWANDGKHFAYTTTRRNGRDTDIHLGDITSNAPSVPILEDTGYWLAGSFSPNDSQLVVTRYISANKSQPYILNVKSGERTPIFAEGESGTMRAGTFTPDGKSIYFASNIEGEFSRLYHLDLTTRKRSLITGHINWDIWGCRLSDDGRYLALVANQDGIATLHIKDLVRKEWLKLPPMPIGQVLGLNFKPNSYQLGVTINSPKALAMPIPLI